jgi:mono/diheme cytochrome c family protein
MNVRPSGFVHLFIVSTLMLPLTGCQQLKAVFAKRASQNMPAYQPLPVTYQDQHWSAYQRNWFYHTSQGSELLPYKWFLALEQPRLKPFGDVPKFADINYLGRFGFLASAADSENPAGLPVGFARDTVVDPQTGATSDIVGLTCAVCHTGQIEYRGKAIRIDGGTAVVDLESFQTELGYAVAFTDKIPGRFDRFATGVLGNDASSDAKKQLRKELKAFLAVGLKESDAAEAGKLYGAANGFARTDALGRIGNFVFGTELDNVNLRPANAPVKLPPLWYTGWFARVQYNNSIQQPMTRNVGESLGVRARVNLTDPTKLFQSTVNVTNLWKMEQLLAGATAFSGLSAPVWPAETLGPIDQQKSHQGAALYRELCQSCHLPPLNSAELQQPQYWEAGQEGRRFLKLNVTPLDQIGTDPREATDFANRTAVTGALGMGTVPVGRGLNTVTVKVRDLKYDALGLTPEQRREWNGYREDNATAQLEYRARPLGGMWATPPFLHNGSVPTLYDLLLPADQRPKSFYTGKREFDPKRVGYDSAEFQGGFLYRVDQAGDAHPGNSNAGHEFRNGSGKGVIGRQLTDDERWSLIEYLKTL